MSHIGIVISEAVKTGKWLYIEYRNLDNQVTNYWCSVIDVHLEDQRLSVKIFNPRLSYEIIDTKLYFDSILSAKLIEGTSYEVPAYLIEKIENNLDKLEWLNFDTFNNNILMYLQECYRYDNDPYQKDFHFIDGVDFSTLKKEKSYNLTATQFGQIIDFIYKTDIDSVSRNKYTFLIINYLSIAIKEKLYVIAYYDVLLDVEKMALVLGCDLKINKSFLVEGKKYTLSQYLDTDPKEFIDKFPSNIKYYTELIAKNLIYGEVLDENPYLMILERNIPINIDDIFAAINDMHTEQKLTVPLKAYFGNITIRNLGHPESHIYFIDDKFNIDQLRVVYNAINNPVTYVQGPPGTGKTSTISNIILSAFMNEKSILISSNNNKPINDIYNKIRFKHQDQDVPFPILRIGIQKENLKTLNKIKDLYNKANFITIKESQLKEIHHYSQAKYNNLNNEIKKYEESVCLQEEKNTLLSIWDNADDENIKMMISMKINSVDERIRNISLINNIKKLAYIGKRDLRFTRYLYYKSFSYIKKLYESQYKQLIDIVHMNDGDSQSKELKNREFLKYLSDSTNFTNFIRTFPFILTTNLSANKLGPAKPFFDLTVIDEAGQCNIATSLIPIIRGNSLALLGDQNQLKPVIVLGDDFNKKLMDKYQIKDVYNYCDNSIIELMQKKDRVSPFILLRYHYRCGRNIINFSNRRYYGNQLKIETKSHPNQLEFCNVKTDDKPAIRNTSYQEAATIVDIIKKNNYQNVGIITPFRNQVAQINALLEHNQIRGVDVGTIHTFQGDEREVVIMSLALTPVTGEKTYNWVKDNSEMINVAVTRPKDKLIIVGDYDLIQERVKNDANSEDNDLYSLMTYVYNNGNCYVPPKYSADRLFFKQYNTQKEKEFLQTISHMMTTLPAYTVESKVKVSSVFHADNFDDFDYFTKAEFDFVIYDKNTGYPLLVIEVDGSEHINNYRTRINDAKKEEICRRRKIKIIRIPNENVRRYNTIKKVIIKILH
ncbi:MAG: AAA domain-containing protein [Bacilli bacterium]|nr:AAA domain-containing protein [Bacilli bacterium]MDD4076672.1 AAA domain-containing protein [Bacilli bacterium]MDD4388174.1 AAA domain-containing protein [Bacilli bacterium]